ncbi:hypothetical protein [Chromobacterium amazonense]|uniref:hypothetical protein n=1 Tax=Chromobacterium amazonense TaxID=1382803 RepID=UPI003F7B0F6C
MSDMSETPPDATSGYRFASPWDKLDLSRDKLRRQYKHDCADVERNAKGYVIRVKGLHRALQPYQYGLPADQQRARELIAQDGCSWAELFELELLAVSLATEEQFGILTAHWREAAPVGVGRNDLFRVVLAGQQRYFKVLRRERALDRLRLHLGAFTLLLASALFGYFLWTQSASASSLALAGLFGILGSFTSILMRIQDAGQNLNGQTSAGIATLMDGSWSLYLALLSGVLFGILGFYAFAADIGGHFLSWDLIPNIEPKAGTVCPGAGHGGCLPYLAGAADYGKMAVWGFFFGFAEKFIPDVLTKLANARSASRSDAS